MEDFEEKNKLLMARIKRAQKQMDKLQAEKKELYKTCPHTHIKRKSHYYSGSYYDKVYTEYWNECSVCGMKSKSDIDGHSYYG